MLLKIIPDALEEMTRNAIQSYPDECCGFLFGREDGSERMVTQSIVVNNARIGDKRRRFEVSPGDYLKAEQLANEKDMLLLGVYHSHPDHPALPSEHDRLAAQPYFSYVILSVKGKELDDIRSWRLNDEQQFDEEIIEP